jgi:hypothetical protein
MIISFFSNQLWTVIFFSLLEPLFFLFIFRLIFKKILKPKDMQEGDGDFLISTLAGLITLACIVIGFAYSIAISNLNQADSNLFREATKIVSLERLLTVEGSHQALEAKKYLDLYAESIVHDEWPEMIKGGHSQKTSWLIGQLLESINKIEPFSRKQEGLFTQIMTESIEVQHSRIQRILNTSMSIPPVFIALTCLLMILIYLVSAILLVNTSKMLKIALPIQACVFSFFVGGICLLDGPYAGSMPITAEPILKALSAR